MNTQRVSKRIPALILFPLCALFLSGLFGSKVHAQSVPAINILQPAPRKPFSYDPSFAGASTIEAKLISPGIGYAIVNGRLLLTNNNGVVWNDITPSEPIMQHFSSLFFLDASHAWLVYWDVSEDSLGGWETAPVHIVRTVDGGRTWIPAQFDRTSYDGSKRSGASPLELSFVDPQNGWFLWRLMSSSAFSLGSLLSTKDGGATWTELPDPPSGNGVTFVTPQDGWTTGLPDSHELWVTHDGGKTWQERTVDPPKNCSECYANYSNPEFADPTDALLDATFSDRGSNLEWREVDCTYLTHDGGESWQATEDCARPSENPPIGITLHVDLQSLRVLSDAELGLQIRSEGGTISPSYPANLPRGGIIAAAQFVDDFNGWLIYVSKHSQPCTKPPDLVAEGARRTPPGTSLQQFLQRGQPRDPAPDKPGAPCMEMALQYDLLYTTDGGKTLTVITPPAALASSVR